MNLGDWMRTLGVVGGIVIIGAPGAALVTLAVASGLALLGLVVFLAFETICEGDRQRAERPVGRDPVRPDRMRGKLPHARVVV